MYKRILIICFLSLLNLNLLYSQEQDESVKCTYSEVELAADKSIAILRTEPKLVNTFTTFEKGRVIDFSLLNYEGKIILNLEIYRDSKAELKPFCISPGDFFELKLINSESIVLPQVGRKLCSTELNSAQKGFQNTKNRGSFLITKENLEKIRQTELATGNLKAGEEEIYFVFKTETYDDVNDKVSYPSQYFIRFLNCVTHPKLVVK